MSGVAFLWLAFAAADPQPAAAGLTIERAVEMALARDERAAIAGERETAAQARLWRARAFFFPELTATGSWTHRDHETRVGDVVIQSRDGLQATGVASITLFDARAFPAWRAARKERDAARLETVETRRDVAFEAADAFLSVLGIQGVRDAAQRRRDLAADALREARARFEAQLVGVNDVTRAELDLAEADRDVIRARGDEELARTQLGFLLGTTVTGPLVPPEDLLAKARTKPALPAPEETARPDVLAARRRAEAAKAISAEPLARALPTVSANATYRTTNEAGFSGREEDWWVGATASWPIFDGGERYADRRERQALARAASLEAQALERRARVQLESARIAIESAQATHAAAIVGLEAAQRNHRETAALYEQGLASALEATTARVSLFEAEVALQRANYDLAAAWLGVPAALGQDPFGRSMVEESP